MLPLGLVATGQQLRAKAPSCSFTCQGHAQESHLGRGSHSHWCSLCACLLRRYVRCHAFHPTRVPRVQAGQLGQRALEDKLTNGMKCPTVPFRACTLWA